MCILMTAFPMSVAPKKVQNGTKKCPHVIPARSNRGFGIYRKKKMDKMLYCVMLKKSDGKMQKNT